MRCRCALLGKEGLRVGLSAQRVGLPRKRILFVRRCGLPNSGNTEIDRIDEPVLWDA
jgi:hypothetical protein